MTTETFVDREAIAGTLNTFASDLFSVRDLAAAAVDMDDPAPALVALRDTLSRVGFGLDYLATHLGSGPNVADTLHWFDLPECLELTPNAAAPTERTTEVRHD